MTSLEWYVGLIACITLTSFFGWFIYFIVTPTEDLDDYDTNGIGNLVVVALWALAIMAAVVYGGLTQYGLTYATWSMGIIISQILGAVAVRLVRKYDLEERMFWHVARLLRRHHHVGAD
jgi:hypothetical protein